MIIIFCKKETSRRWVICGDARVREGKENSHSRPVYFITETETDTEHQTGTRHVKSADPTAG